MTKTYMHEKYRFCSTGLRPTKIELGLSAFERAFGKTLTKKEPRFSFLGKEKGAENSLLQTLLFVVMVC
jgi:hypothetical protein